MLIRWQGPQPRRDGAEKQTSADRQPPADQGRQTHKPAYASVAAHHETTEADDLLFVSSLEKALSDSEKASGRREPADPGADAARSPVSLAAGAGP